MCVEVAVHVLLSVSISLESKSIGVDVVGHIVLVGNVFPLVAAELCSTLGTESGILVVMAVTDEFCTPTAGVFDLTGRAEFTLPRDTHAKL
jgi:hypothetical protein